MAECTGACIFGTCPNKVCVKYDQKHSKAKRINISSNILSSVPGSGFSCDSKGYGIATDIGTTTVVVYLYNRENGVCLSTRSALNSQITLGVDVISRIGVCSKEGGLEALHDAITGLLNELTEGVCMEAGISVSDIEYAVITGNTTMLHLLEGLSPVSMGVLPFKPESYFGYDINASEAGLSFGCPVYLVPCMSAFVGGDITSAVLASGMCSRDEISLLMDLGTNGELAIGNKDRILTTSTAAGPAFEGAEIEKGMAGVKGAVSCVYPVDGKVEFDVIGDAKPRGLCGSGILDMAALFVKTGVIDESGYINDNDEYVRELDGSNAVWLDENVYLTQKDIRHLQTAKASVAGGVRALIHAAGFTDKDIDTVYIAGGFGNYMQPESAVDIGLIDRAFADRLVFIGNGAGIGASMALLNSRFIEEGQRIAGLSTHVELGGDPYFMEQYVDCMMF